MANPPQNPLGSTPMTQRGVLLRDDNETAVQGFGLTTSTSVTFTGDNTTVVTPIFHITGTVEVLGIYGIVTTDLGANHTAAAWRLNDQSAQVNITLNTGVDISGAKAGSSIVKKGLAAAAAVYLNNSAGRISEPTTLETMYFSPFVAVKKTAATTDIEYVYATTDSPTSGAMQFFVQWYPLSADGRVTPV